MDGLRVRHVPVAAVVIGRNEGERLKRCLLAMPAGIPIVYVDSGSTDGSVAFARSRGVSVVMLDTSVGFTAARARNAGWRAFAEQGVEPTLVQFVDGDCELDAGWLVAGRAALIAEPGLAIVFGRRRERFPERSLYNRLCDEEWNVPVGLVNACGGDALVRMTALREVDGYSDDLIAGEEPDMCLRLRRRGWTIRRIDAEMTLHDAAILTFGAWWKRTRRSGFAYAAHVLRHGSGSDRQWRRQVRSIAFWGLVWPVSMIGLGVICASNSKTLVAALVLGALVMSYALMAMRIARWRRAQGSTTRTALQYGGLTMMGKFAEALGMLECWSNTLRGQQSQLIEYKGGA